MYGVSILKSEKGTVLIVAILVLCILTLIGISATTTTTIDLQIAANERDYSREFYVADSVWKQAANWLDVLAFAPPNINSSGDIVRNYGDGGQDQTNSSFPAGTEDNIIDGIPSWYRATYITNTVAPGSGAEYRRFFYSSTANANRSQEIEVTLSKIFKVGY